MFRCIKDLQLDMYDDDGEIIEDKKMEVTKGSEWSICESCYREIEGKIRLENDNAEWIEITRKTFKEHFIEIQ